MKKKITFLLSGLFCPFFWAASQVSVLSSGFHPMNVTPSALLQVTLLSDQEGVTAQAEAEITNSAGQRILFVTSMPFILKTGVNQFMADQIKVAQTNYGTCSQAGFVQTNHTLPSGLYKYCVRVVVQAGEYADEYCDDVQSDFSSFLNLVSPFDKDTIEEKNPMLIWTHSEPFNLLSPGEFFRITVVEKQTDQTSEAAVAANQPVFFQNYIIRHEIQYPFDAKVLETGKTYAWHVQKLAAGGQTVIDKTEAWQFTIAKPPKRQENKYAILKKKYDATYYTVFNEKIFFQFDEPYHGSKLNYRVYNSKRKEIKIVPINEDRTFATQNNALDGSIKKQGSNQYQLDLAPYNLKPGYYYLEVWDEKKHKGVLKFYVSE